MKTLREELTNRWGLIRGERSFWHWVVFAKYPGMRSYTPRLRFTADTWAVIALIAAIGAILYFAWGGSGVAQ